jgi:uncharacterized Fe-S cluster protein YjdI
MKIFSFWVVVLWISVGMQDYQKRNEIPVEFAFNNCMCQENGSCYRGNGNQLSAIT